MARVGGPAGVYGASSTVGPRWLAPGVVTPVSSNSDTTRPSVVSASVNAAGGTLTITCDESLTGSTFTGITLVDSRGLTTHTLSSFLISTTTITATISATVKAGETVTLNVDGVNVPTDGSGNKLNAVVSGAVTNNSTTLDPNYVATLLASYEGRKTPGSNGDALASIPDLSPNGYSLTQGTGSKQPTLRTNQANGNAVIRFDGADDGSINTALGAALAGTDQPRTIFLVVKMNATTANQNLLAMSGGGNPLWLVDINSTRWRTLIRDDAATNGNSFFGATNVDTTTFHVLTLNYTGTVLNLWLDGTQVATNVSIDLGAITTTVFALGSRAGTSNYASEDVADVKIYSTSLSTGASGVTEAIRDYLRTAYGTL